jgi:hypothetical protein
MISESVIPASSFTSALKTSPTLNVPTAPSTNDETGPPTGPSARDNPVMSMLGATRPPAFSVAKAKGTLATVANTCPWLPMLLAAAAR